MFDDAALTRFCSQDSSIGFGFIFYANVIALREIICFAQFNCLVLADIRKPEGEQVK